jgi:hypothetical protein
MRRRDFITLVGVAASLVGPMGIHPEAARPSRGAWSMIDPMPIMPATLAHYVADMPADMTAIPIALCKFAVFVTSHAALTKPEIGPPTPACSPYADLALTWNASASLSR